MSTGAVKGDNALSLNPAHLTVLEKYGGKRGQQILTLIAAGQVLGPLAARAYGKVRNKDTYKITVAGVDDIYPNLHDWVLERMPESERKALIATTVANYRGVGADDDIEPGEGVRLRYDGSRSQEVTIEGYKVVVAVEREDISSRWTNLPENWRQYMERITFTAGTAAGRDAVVRMIDGLLIAKRRSHHPPALFMPSRWGGEWVPRGDLPPRSIESAILKEGQLERLIDDLGGFLAAEQEYVRLSQPWHRGYLFHGAPGTGKTSVARALASHFGLPTYYLPLGDIEHDTNLMKFVASIEPRSVLLLEDVDAYSAATSRQENEGKVSIAAMLNALDGVWTPHGLITIMTTNNRGALDEALIRAGRVDVDEEFTVLDDFQATRLMEFFGAPGFDTTDFVGKSPSELIEGLRRYRSPQPVQG